MDKNFFSKVTALAVAFILLQGAVSCKREELTITEDNIDLTVNVFSEGVVLPIGSLDTLTIADLLASVEDMDDEWLSVLKGGAYAISYKGTYDLSDSLNTMLKDLDIKPFRKEEYIDLDLKDVDVSDIKVEAQRFPEDGPYKVDLSEFVTAPDMPAIEPIEEFVTVASGIYKYAPHMNAIKLPVDPIYKEMVLITVPSTIDMVPGSDDPIALDDAMRRQLGIYIYNEFDANENVDINLTLPQGVNSVSDIVLDENAGLKVTLALENTFLQKGRVVPEMDIDLRKLLHIDTEKHDDIVHLAKDFVLTENDKLEINGVMMPFAKSKTYSVTGLVINEGDWKNTDNGYALVQKREITAKGSVELYDLETTVNYIKTHKNTTLYVNLEFVNFEIDDVVMGVDSLTEEKSEEVEVEIPATTIPEEIEKIDWVGFDDNSVITIKLEPSNIEGLPDLGINLDCLNIDFPEGMEISVKEGNSWTAVDGTSISVVDESLRNGYLKEIRVDRFNLPGLDKDHKLALKDAVKVYAKVTAGGSVNSANLPVDEKSDITFDISVDGKLTIDDYQATIAGYDHEIEPIEEDINIELSEEVKDLGTVTVYPEGEPVITIDITMPQTKLDIHPMTGKGIRIILPQMVRFKDVDRLKKEYGYDDENAPHSLNFSESDEIPSQITLPVDKIVIVPELDETDGKYYSKGKFRFEGGVSLGEGAVTKVEVEALADKAADADNKVVIVANVPEILPATMNVDQYSTSIEEKMELDIPLDDLPEELVSVGVVELKGVFLDFAIDLSSLTEYIVDADINIDINVEFPDFIKLDRARLDSEGKLVIPESISKDELVGNEGIITIEPIAVEALDLTGRDLSAGISGEILVNGGVSIADATITDDLLGKTHKVKIDAGVKEIIIDKVNAQVDYQMEPMVESIDLSELTEMFKDESLEATFDLNRFHLALELTTDVSIPLIADIELIPYFDGVAGEPLKPEKPIEIKTAESVDEVSVTKIWIANNDEHKPADCDVFVELDLLSLIKKLPEKIDFSFSGGTDKNGNAVIGLEDEMTLMADYEVALPLEFGEDFEISYRKTISDLDEVVAQVFSYADLALKGEFVNGLPLELDVMFNLLDSEGNVVVMDETAGKQVIPSCALDGTATKCDLNIALIKQKDAEITDISAIEVIITANSGDAAGVSLKDTGFVSGRICVALPNGLTIDLGELMDEDK